jgi:DNA-binding transcriptional regulator YhcF (GntR family)
MPNALVKKIHEQTGKSNSTIEKVYKTLENEGVKNHARNKFAYATGTIEKIMHYKPKSK